MDELGGVEQAIGYAADRADLKAGAFDVRIVPAPLTGGVWKAHHDHRMATTGALIGLHVPGVEIDDIGTTAKTLPEFTLLWERMLGTS